MVEKKILFKDPLNKNGGRLFKSQKELAKILVENSGSVYHGKSKGAMEAFLSQIFNGKRPMPKALKDEILQLVKNRIDSDEDFLKVKKNLEGSRDASNIAVSHRSNNKIITMQQTRSSVQHFIDGILANGCINYILPRYNQNDFFADKVNKDPDYVRNFLSNIRKYLRDTGNIAKNKKIELREGKIKDYSKMKSMILSGNYIMPEPAYSGFDRSKQANHLSIGKVRGFGAIVFEDSDSEEQIKYILDAIPIEIENPKINPRNELSGVERMFDCLALKDTFFISQSDTIVNEAFIEAKLNSRDFNNYENYETLTNLDRIKSLIGNDAFSDNPCVLLDWNFCIDFCKDFNKAYPNKKVNLYIVSYEDKVDAGFFYGKGDEKFKEMILSAMLGSYIIDNEWSVRFKTDAQNSLINLFEPRDIIGSNQIKSKSA